MSQKTLPAYSLFSLDLLVLVRTKPVVGCLRYFCCGKVHYLILITQKSIL